jgi:hypothetical protein
MARLWELPMGLRITYERNCGGRTKHFVQEKAKDT